MQRRWVLSILIGTLAASGCLFKEKKRVPLAADRPIPPLPSALEKAQPPAPPTPVAASTVNNTLPDTTEYKAVAIPAPPAPAAEVVPVVAQAAAEAPDDDKEKERKRLLDRLREKREERKDERAKEAPKLPSAIAPKEAPTPGTPMKSGSADIAAARKLYDLAHGKYEKMTDYEVQLTRREVVAGKEMPTEEVLFQFRKQPFSIYMRNTGDHGKGREVLYVDGKFDGLMHVVTGQGDNRLIGAGFKTSLKPDSSMATSKSRHMITEAGPGQLLVRFEKHLKAAEAGQRTIKSLGKVQRKDQPNPVEGIEITVPPGDDPLLQKGGKWSLFFDPASGNLMANVLQDETGREVEYYSFAKWRVPANLTDADFHPDRLGAKKK